MTGAWDRELRVDIAAVRAWNADAVVCLLEPHELKLLKVEALPQAVEQAGMKWFQLPIRDAGIPEATFEKAWPFAGAELRSILLRGGRVLVHCRGGLGRSGMIAACLLVECGIDAGRAITLVRQHRPGAIENSAQEQYVRKYAPCWMHGEETANLSIADRAAGCLVGLAVGDALGTTLEFARRDSKPPVTDLVGGGPFGLKPGEWTDDTSMALCLADTLLARGQLDAGDLMERFRRWRDEGYNSVTGKCFDIGIATRQAISRYASDGNPFAGSTDPMSAGNGSIMRLAPVPIFHANDAAAAEEAAIRQSRTTHGAQECSDACQLMARILVRLMNGMAWEDVTAASHPDPWMPKIRALAEGRWKGRKRAQIRSTGYVVDTLEAALWAVDSTSSFEEAVLLAVNLADDADTVGAVTGQLAGARYGYQAISKKWATGIAWSEKIVSMARSLSAGFGVGI